jgi:hypothetical protein
MIIIILTYVTNVSAQQQSEAEKSTLGITLDTAYVSRYIWRGFDCYPNNHSATQPSVNFDIYQTGFGINIWSSMANGSGFEDFKELDYTLYYYNTFFKDLPFATDYTFGWIYYSYPGISRKTANMQEAFATLSWPNICPIGIIPKYTAACLWAAESNSGVRDNGGWFHIFGLGYDLYLPAVLKNTDKQIVHLSVETVYNDSAYIPCEQRFQNVDHDWSHAVFSISSSFNISRKLIFTPAFYYQSSWEKSVNTQDEYWVSLSLRYEL